VCVCVCVCVCVWECVSCINLTWNSTICCCCCRPTNSPGHGDNQRVCGCVGVWVCVCVCVGGTDTAHRIVMHAGYGWGRKTKVKQQIWWKHSVTDVSTQTNTTCTRPMSAGQDVLTVFGMRFCSHLVKFWRAIVHLFPDVFNSRHQGKPLRQFWFDKLFFPLVYGCDYFGLCLISGEKLNSLSVWCWLANVYSHFTASLWWTSCCCVFITLLHWIQSYTLISLTCINDTAALNTVRLFDQFNLYLWAKTIKALTMWALWISVHPLAVVSNHSEIILFGGIVMFASEAV